MELRHRLLVFANDPKFDLLKRELSRLSCPFRTKQAAIEVDFSDNDSFSSNLKALAKEHNFWLVSGLHYEKEEILAAEWVEVSVGEFQYPQPENVVVAAFSEHSKEGSSYLEASYDLTE